MEKVLCVNDDPSLLCLYHDEFTEEGYKVILAKDGQEALMKFEKESPDVVVMDIRMPVMDGIQTTTAMLEKDRRVQVILNTAYPHPIPGEFYDLGCRHFCDQIIQSKRAQAKNPGGSQKEGKAHKTIIFKGTSFAGKIRDGPFKGFVYVSTWDVQSMGMIKFLNLIHYCWIHLGGGYTDETC